MFYILWTCIYNTAFLCFFILVFFFYFYRKNKHCCCFFFVRWTTWEYIKISLIWWQKSCEKCVCRMFGILFFLLFYFMEWLFADSCTENTFQNQFHFFFFCYSLSVITIGVAKQTEHMIVPRVLPKLFPDKATYKKFKGNMYSLSCTIFYFIFFYISCVASCRPYKYNIL